MRILWLKTELLHPVDKGGKIRTYNMLKQLKRDHHVTYLSLDDGTAPQTARADATEYCHNLITIPHRTRPKFSAGFYVELLTNLFSPLPYFVKKYQSAGMRQAIEQLIKQDQFDVLVCDFLQPSINVPETLAIDTILFQHNVESMIWKRHYEVQRNPLKKAYLYRQWRKSWIYEGSACRRFDMVVAVSDADEDQMRKEFELEHVASVPTGVDVEYFCPGDGAVVDPHNLVFTGSMDWLPNEDAMQYFIREVLPLVRKSIPDVTLTIVGRNPYPSLLELSNRDKSIIVTGRVADVRPYIERCAAYIVPIRIGGGTRLKIYEAMAMERPVVSTTIGAEGLTVTNGRDLLLADTPDEFSQAIIRLLTTPAFALELGQQAASAVRSQFAWDRVSTVFADICAEVVERRKSAGNTNAFQKRAKGDITTEPSGFMKIGVD
jgi:sugar transferase (PEP-CTERM/EpsH1 system associated)